MVDLEPYGFANSLEQIWLRPLDGKAYEVSCIPFRVYGLALNDVVELDSDGKRITGLLRSSGHRVFRIFLAPALSVPESSEVQNSITRAIIDDVLEAEWSGDRHVAIDVPIGCEVARVWAAIELLAAEEKIYWEWGDVEPFRR
ncbi:DUF4265 domain-containing protein [Micromonospora sp. NBC_01699]|uniref:DUF4265 domain-containing protein n=1 Tax=Micromonospora sp. NBC_01699 TaxID=2975984 RepID=UPI002E2DE384|nr:DUF4265 domain-containing protein [Micromonospora sp. NBC_01699]